MTGYIFIVGPSRSGTTLLANILNKGDNICVNPAIHFVGHLLRPVMRQKIQREFGTLEDDDNVRRFVDEFYAGKLIDGIWWKNVTETYDKELLLREILNSDRSEPAVYTALMQAYAQGKSIIGEKSPSLRYYISTLLAWFPDAKFVHTFRDPRAIFASELKKRQSIEANFFPYTLLNRVKPLLTLFVLLHVTIVWLQTAIASRKYERRYPQNYTSIKFEDIVLDPEPHIQELCRFLEIEFQEKMLRQEVVVSSFTQTYKRTGQYGFNTQAVERWKEHISPWANRWFLFWTGRHLRELGYIH